MKLSKVWALRWELHVLALGVLLVLFLPLVDPHVSYSADEGAAIIQAQSLASGRGWIVPHPLPEVDPSGAWFPLDNAEWGERGAAAYAKHPAYPLVLAAADRVAGVVGMVLLSVLGTVVAAAGAAVLTSHLRPGGERAAVWSLGLLSPLFFNSYWVIAHSLAAACAVWAVVAAIVAVDRRRWGCALLCGVAVGGATALRTEGRLLALAVVLASSILLVRRRDVMWLLVALSTAGGAVVVSRLEAFGLHAAVGRSVPSPQARAALSTDNRVYDALVGGVRTWIVPTVGRAPLSGVLLAVACGLAAIAGWELGQRRPQEPVIRVVAAAAATLIVLRVTFGAPQAVPGLLPAFPLFWVGLLAGRRRRPEGTAAAFVLMTFALGVVGVVATQYRVGGDTEWGGRYFAIFLPLIVPFSVAGLRDAGKRLGPGTRQVALCGLVAGSVALSALAVRELRTTHAETRRFYRAVDLAARTLPEPVIVTTTGFGARLAWATFDRQEWLYVRATAGQDLGATLARAGIERFVLVSTDVAADLELFEDLRIDDSTVTPSGGMAVVAYDPPPGANIRS